MTAFPRNLLIALTVFFVAGGWGWHQQRGINEQRAELAAAETVLAEARRQQAAAVPALENLRQELAAERSQRDAALAAAVGSNRLATGRANETRWTRPPSTWPAWETGSPYIWLRKEALANLGVPAFTEEGVLTPELAKLLEIEPSARAAITERAQRLLAEWRAGETERAARTDQHPYNAGEGPGPTVTVVVPPQPELAARLREEFTATLRETLGEQRAKLLAGFARDRLAEELGPESSSPERPVKPVSYTVQREGREFRVIVHGPSGSSSSSTGPQWRGMIPAHLHERFAEAFGEQVGR